MYLISLCMFFYECEIKLISLDKFSVDCELYLISVEWFGTWSVQPNMTFPFCIYFMHMVERMHNSTQDLPRLLEWGSPWIWIYIYIYIYIFRPIYTLGRDITCLLLAGLRGVKLWHFIKQCEIEEEIWCVVNNTTCCNRTNSVELILEEQRILSTINHLTYWNVTLHLPL